MNISDLDALLKEAPRTVVHGETDVYLNKWVDVVKVDITPPNTRRFEHHVIRLQRVAAVAVVMDTKVLMLGRHRWPVDACGWELPGGIVDAEEEGDVAAAREVREETGWYPRGHLEPLVSYQPMPGMVDTPHELYLARDAEYEGDPTDAEEAGVVAWVPLDLLREMVRTGRVASSGSLVGVLCVLAGLDRGDESSKASGETG